MRTKLYLLLVLLGMTLSSCSNFLEEYSQNSTYVESVDDLSELLLGSGVMNRNTWRFSFLHLMSDELAEMPILNKEYEEGGTLTWEKYGGVYSWAQQPFTYYDGTAYADTDWKSFYSYIQTYNSILVEADALEEKGKGGDALDQVKGEVLFLRAWNYFMLANIYGLPYDKQNPKDGGNVILRTSSVITADKLPRNHSGEVYEQIVSDLNEAARLLQGKSNSSKQRCSADACYALLSRVYLYMESYADAIKAANQVRNYHLYDLVNDYEPGSGESFLTLNSPEIIFTQGLYSLDVVMQGTGRSYPSVDIDWENSDFTTGDIKYVIVYKPVIYSSTYICSDEMLELFDENDRRYSAFFTKSYGRKYLICRKFRNALQDKVTETDPITGKVLSSTSGRTVGNEAATIRYAEVLLNKAEAQAALGDAEAVNTIKTLLDARYIQLPAIPGGGEELIRFIRRERQKELCFEGHRWFDLRRYAVNTILPEKISITHTYHTKVSKSEVNVAGTFTLQPYSESTKGLWTLPVPDDVVDFCYPNFITFDRTQGVVVTNN